MVGEEEEGGGRASGPPMTGDQVVVVVGVEVADGAPPHHITDPPRCNAPLRIRSVFLMLTCLM